MSLIHNALKEMDRLGTPDATAALPILPVTARSSVLAPLAIALIVMLGAGGVAFAGWKMIDALPTATAVAVPRPADATSLVAVVPVAVPLAPAAAPLLEVIAPPVAGVPVPMPDRAEAMSMPNAPPSQAPLMAAVVTREAEPPAARPQRVRVDGITGRAGVPSSVGTTAREAGAAEAVPAERRFVLFLEAMRLKDIPGAEHELAGLRRQLTRSSLSLVRAEAWFAYASGDTATARQEYREVIERSPGDEEASINLASIEAAQQQTEVARQILSNALRVNPESEVLKSTLATFGGRR